MLHLDEARRHGPGHLLAVCWRQWRTEQALARRGIRFRITDPSELARVYAAMTEAEFEAINGRQDWANWRTIPRALHGRVPDRPLLVLDLGCGSGGSTRVLAWCCPIGSAFVGYELVAPLVEIARRRRYRRCDGQAADVSFSCQGLTEPFRLPGGEPVAGRSVDLINSSGVVGHHLDEQTIVPLIREIGRVLKDDGLVALDVGPTLGRPALERRMTEAGFHCRGHAKSWVFDPTGQLIFSR